MPAATIRAIRRFHEFTRDEFADVFGVDVRTIFRWEKEGVDPNALALDPGAVSGPEWRRKYMNWLLGRYLEYRLSLTPEKRG